MTAKLLTPRDYQLECIRAIWTRWDAGTFRPASVLPTGAGKTVVFSHLAEEYLSKHPGRRVLVLSHTDELVQQAANKMRQVAPHRTVGIVKAERREVTAQVISASVQSLRSKARRDQLRNVGLIIVDECHHAVAVTYRTILQHFGALPSPCDSCNGTGGAPDESTGGRCWDCQGTGLYNGGQTDCLLAGFTATLVRGDKAKLSEVWEDVAFRRDIAFMIRRGYLLDVKGRRVVVPDLDLGRVKTSGGDFREGSLGEELERAMAPEVVAKAYVEHAGDRKGLVFAPTVESAYAFADAFLAEGIKTEVVHGALARDERRAILARLKSGDTQVVANCMVLTEGFDEPSVSCAVIARPTKSSGLYQQMVGRVLRPDLTLPTAERGHALILDVVGISARHDLSSLIDLSSREDLADRELDEDLTLLELEDLTLLDEGMGEGGGLEPEVYYAGPVEVEDFDPLARDSHQMWGRTPDGLYWMTAGVARFIFLCPSLTGDPGTFDVVWCSKPDPQTRDRKEQDLLRDNFPDRVYAGLTDHQGLPFEMALSWAEEAAEELAGVGLKTFARKGTKWRREEPSDAQKWKAGRVGVAIPEGISKGDLSHLIDTVLAGRRVDGLVRTVLAARKN